ncbi:MAG: NADH-quinone oxidoreductase subunit B [Anaerolineae bacterium]|mgnify:FL=1|jgi:NADH-quinone oxidoreductase subunit B
MSDQELYHTLTVPETLVPEDLRRNVLLTTVDAAYNWARRRSMWPLTFGLACCALEMIAAGAARYDYGRLGMDIPFSSPRQSDLLILSGTITHKMAPQVLRIWNQMPEPKYAIAMGACTVSGGTFKSYAVVQGASDLIPVDIYLPGCPPRPEALIYAFTKLHEMVGQQSVKTVSWYRKEEQA